MGLPTSFENKNLHVANDEVEKNFILEGGKGMWDFILFSIWVKGVMNVFFGGSIVKTPSFQ